MLFAHSHTWRGKPRNACIYINALRKQEESKETDVLLQDQ
jgi:hypothetical protein